MYQFVTALLVIDPLSFCNALQCDLYQGARLRGCLVQVTMQLGVVFVPIGTLRAVDLECRQIPNELCQVMGTLAVNSGRCPRQPRQLLVIEQALRDRSGHLPP